MAACNNAGDKPLQVIKLTLRTHTHTHTHTILAIEYLANYLVEVITDEILNGIR